MSTRRCTRVDVRAMGVAVVLATVTTVVLGGSGVAQADQTRPVVAPYVHEYPTTGLAADDGITSMATGSDDRPWFVTFDGTAGRVNADHTTSLFQVAGGHDLFGLVRASDGPLWTSDTDPDAPAAVRIAADGAARRTALPGEADSIAAQSDGSVWYADADAARISRVTADGVLTTFTYRTTGTAGTTDENGLVRGADGDLWFRSDDQAFIGRITPAGVVTEFPTGGRLPQTLFAGPDGTPWIEFDDGTISSVSATGVFSPKDTRADDSYIIDTAIGADGRVWALEWLADGGSDVVAITSAGVVTYYAIPHSTTTLPYAISAAPDGTLWFEQTSDADGGGPNDVASITTNGVSRAFPVAQDVNATTATSTGIWFGEDDGTVATAGSASVDRISGSSRYATSVALAQAAEPATGGTVYVATGTNYPDALAAGPAAAKAGGPLLLTAPTALPDVVAAELHALAPKRVVIVGGASAVSATVASQIIAATGPTATVDRIAGTNRFDTARRIDLDAFGAAPVASAYVATGTNYPDALAAAAAAGAQGVPVVLVNGGSSSLDTATTDLLTSLRVTSTPVVGGPSAVSPGIQTALAARFGAAGATRVAGGNRFDTAARIAQSAFPDGASHVYVATGTAFPDALAGSALAAAKGSPLLTTRTSCLPSGTATEIAALGAQQVTLIGGPAALTADVAALHICN